jgi:hypothetical protein
MIRKVKLTAGFLLSILILSTSCNEKEYEMPELAPVVKFSLSSKKITAQTYIVNSANDVEVSFEFMRSANKEVVYFSLSRTTPATSALEQAFSLSAADFAVTPADVSTQTVGTIDWSKVKPGEKFNVKLTITGDEVFVGPSTGTITLTFEKPVAPLIWLDKDEVYTAIIPKDFEGESMVIPVTFPVTADDVLAEISMPIYLNQYYATLGVHFNISDPVIRIAPGAKTATLQVEVFKAAFAPGEVKRLWIEMRAAQMPIGTLARIDAAYWWTAIDLGLEN